MQLEPLSTGIYEGAKYTGILSELEPTDAQVLESAENQWSIRLRLLGEAMEDLCAVYGFQNPLNESRVTVR